MMEENTNNVKLYTSEGFLKNAVYLTYIVEAAKKISQLQNLNQIKLILNSEVLIGGRKSTPRTIVFNDDGSVVTINITYSVAYLKPDKTTSPPSVASIISSIENAIAEAEKQYKEKFVDDKTSNTNYQNTKNDK